MPYRPVSMEVRTLGDQFSTRVVTHYEYEPACDHFGSLEAVRDGYHCVSCGENLTDLEAEAFYHLHQRESQRG